MKSIKITEPTTLKKRIYEKLAKNRIARNKILRLKRMPRLLRSNQSGRHTVIPIVKTGLLKLLQSVRKRRTAAVPIRMNTKTLTFARFNPRTGRNHTNSTVTVKYANTNNNSVLVVKNSCLPTQAWLHEQSNYIKNLNDYDFLTAAAYTVRSYEWIGEWLRTRAIPSVSFSKPHGFVTPLFPQVKEILSTRPPSFLIYDWVKRFLNESTNNVRQYNYFHDNINRMPFALLRAALNLYVMDLQRIIRNAPPLPNTICVYRGIYTDVFRGQIGVQHKLKEFASAAYVPQRTYAPDRYVRIKLIKGVRVLLLQGLNKWKNNGEFEILLNKDSHYIIRKRNLMRHVINNNNSNGNTTRQVEVTDITVTN